MRRGTKMSARGPPRRPRYRDQLPVTANETDEKTLKNVCARNLIFLESSQTSAASELQPATILRVMRTRRRRKARARRAFWARGARAAPRRRRRAPPASISIYSPIYIYNMNDSRARRAPRKRARSLRKDTRTASYFFFPPRAILPLPLRAHGGPTTP